MSYYPTLEEDVTRAKEILAKGRMSPEDFAEMKDPAMRELAASCASGVIFGADTYAAYKLLESFVAAIEAIGPKVCELALRVERMPSRDERRAALIVRLRAEVAGGATHECGEWRTSAGTCQLCDRPLPEAPHVED